MNRKKRDYFEGCLLGGAVGDALGAPVEFMSLQEILNIYGAAGIADFDPAYGKIGTITDDTQMTLFTAEGLILSRTRSGNAPAAEDVLLGVYHAYLRWLSTQDKPNAQKMVAHHGTCSMLDGILIGFRELHKRRAPGSTCLSSLKSGVLGTVETPINDRKGCGAVMRIAPVGLVEPTEKVFDTACRIAALTHGHPTGYLAAGCMAQIICEIVGGQDLLSAISTALRILKGRATHKECAHAIAGALSAWEHRPVDVETVESIGRGWIAEEALAIGIYCALAAGTDFKKGIALAVNHGGDSDSTGSIAGNLMGVLLGRSAIPEHYLAHLELADLIEEISGDLYALTTCRTAGPHEL